MALDTQLLNAIEKLVRSEFAGSFKGAPTSYPLFTSEINDTEGITWFEWIGALPKVRQWVGARHAKEMTNYNYSIRNLPWELTIKVPYSKMLDKSRTALAGFARNKINQLGSQFRKDYPAETVIQTLDDGTTNLAYDSVAFFANTGRTNVNLVNGSGTTVDNILSDLNTNRAAMKNFVDEESRKLNITGNLAVIPPGLETKFMEITRAKLRSATDNIYYGALDYVVDGRLSDANDWYLLATNEFIKPLLFVSVGDVNVAVKDTTFDDRSITVGADAMGNIGYSFPQLAIKVVNT